MLTLTDLFCGAGGSSTGATQVPGLEVKYAANHWDLAIETHNRNHPDVEHLHENISQTDPLRILGTDILWASPECTNHSRAKGRKKHTGPDLFGDTITEDAIKRSRATMWDVIRFTEAHRYRIVLVENVVEVFDWGDDNTARGGLFQVWLMAMDSLGYKHRIISLNSMHAGIFGQPAPQSRDRVYIAFWRKNNPEPEFEQLLRPKAWCSPCNRVVESKQWWKKGDGQNRPGRYRSQYLYRCPNASCHNSIVEPAWLPASSVIDWSDLGERIGDRKKPLAEKTMRRIKMGIEKFWTPIHLEHGGNGYDAADPKHPRFGDPESYYRAWPISEPLKTMHTRESKGIALHPLMVNAGGNWDDSSIPASDPFRTQTTADNQGVAFPPSFITELRGGGSTARATSDPLATVTASGNHHALTTYPPLTMAYYGSGSNTRPASDPISTMTTVERHSLLTPGRTIDMEDIHFRMLSPLEIKMSMAFNRQYELVGNRREQVKMAGNAVTPPAARDLLTIAKMSLL